MVRMRTQKRKIERTLGFSKVNFLFGHFGKKILKLSAAKVRQRMNKIQNMF